VKILRALTVCAVAATAGFASNEASAVITQNLVDPVAADAFANWKCDSTSCTVTNYSNPNGTDGNETQSGSLTTGMFTNDVFFMTSAELLQVVSSEQTVHKDDFVLNTNGTIAMTVQLIEVTGTTTEGGNGIWDAGETIGAADLGTAILFDTTEAGDSAFFALASTSLNPSSSYVIRTIATIATPTSSPQYNGLIEVAAIPIPGAAWLFGSALFGLLGFSRMRRRREGVA